MMMNEARKIDHIAYSVFDLDQASDFLEQRLGIRPVFGGYHKTLGTKNALLHIGNGSYLELLAIDTDNTAIKPPRWMGIDFLTAPKITRWAVKSGNLAKDSVVLQEANPKMGTIQGASRKIADGSILAWQLTMPLPEPEVELMPFLIDWSVPEKHPTTNLEKGCVLRKITATHPNPNAILPLLEKLQIDLEIKKAKEVRLNVHIKGPKGSIEI